MTATSPSAASRLVARARRPVAGRPIEPIGHADVPTGHETDRATELSVVEAGERHGATRGGALPPTVVVERASLPAVSGAEPQPASSSAWTGSAGAGPEPPAPESPAGSPTVDVVGARRVNLVGADPVPRVPDAPPPTTPRETSTTFEVVAPMARRLEAAATARERSPGARRDESLAESVGFVNELAPSPPVRSDRLTRRDHRRAPATSDTSGAPRSPAGQPSAEAPPQVIIGSIEVVTTSTRRPTPTDPLAELSDRRRGRRSRFTTGDG